MTTNPDPILAVFRAHQADLGEITQSLELLVNHLNRYREALELVVGAGRPHGGPAGGDMFGCETCEAYEAARRALESDPEIEERKRWAMIERYTL